MSNVIVGCVSLVCVERSRFIGLQCAKGRGIILPGGKWEKGEKYTKTASRELREETDIVCDNHELFFQGFAEDGSYTYAFLAKGIAAGNVHGVLGKNFGSGVVDLYSADDFINGPLWGGYYELMFSELWRINANRH